jgi:putative component of membrane protein insertase Oxa1/YidC/SpoIIIJ protein YidD
MLALIRLYQRTLTRWTPTCPQSPSCSEYAIHAIRSHGTRQGIALAIAHIEHCRTP